MYIANIARIKDEEIRRVLMSMVGEIQRQGEEIARLQNKPRMAIKDGVLEQFQRAQKEMIG